jgi:Ice-binding-like/Putative Ig domain
MKRTYLNLLVSAAVVALLFVPSHAWAQAPSLGTAASYGVLAASTVTNTGPTTVIGNVGVSPGTAIVGFPPGSVTGGTFHSADAVALQAQNDVTTAYNDLAGLPCLGPNNLTGLDLGGRTLGPGVYCFSSSAGLTGTLTLNAAGDPNAQFIFQIGSTLTTATNSIVSVIGGGSNCNVYWQVGSSATIGTATAFAGNILALTSITVTTGANVAGRLLARNGAVTLDTNNVAVCPACPLITLSSPTFPAGTVGVAYGPVTITASGGTAPYAFTLLSGTLPPGLTLSSGGVVSGMPTTVGSSTFTVKATDSVNPLCFGTHVYTIVINPAVGCPPVLTCFSPSTLPGATTGVPYGPGGAGVQIGLGCGAGTYSFGAVASLLPPGLTMSSGGLILGTPTRTGSFSFTITATDAAFPLCISGSQLYSILVGCPVITIAPLPDGTVGNFYGPVTITPSIGTPPYTYAISSGSGLGVTLAGAILSGTPTGTGTVTITVTDSAGCAFARSFAIGAAFTAVGGPTLDSLGLSILILLLAAAGVFLVNRFTV